MQKALTALLAQCNSSRSHISMAVNISDCGGVVLNLQGGEYLLSAPLVIPIFFGNINVNTGTLRASQSFPTSRWLVEVGDIGCKTGENQGCCNEFVNFFQVFFDASHRACGGLRVAHTMGTTVKSSFFIHFPVAGLRVDSGHEVTTDSSWFAEYYWDEKNKNTSSVSVGVLLNGNDHLVTNVIVFDFTRVGVEVNGGANVLTNVHTWNGGGVGIAVNANSVRLQNCYLDYNYLQLTDPDTVVVENTFFLATNAHLVVGAKASVNNLIFQGNTYANYGSHQGLPSIQIDNPPFKSAKAVKVANELKATVSTEISRTFLANSKQASWTFDFSSDLLFPELGVEFMQYSVLFKPSAPPTSVSYKAMIVDKTKVTVLFDAATDLVDSFHFTVRQAV